MLKYREKLKNKQKISKLYEKGSVIKNYPLRMVYLQVDEFENSQVGFSVSKRNFKRAVDRNSIKRQLREQYRLNKNIVYSKVDKKHIFMITFIDKQKWNYEDLDKKMKKLLTKFTDEVQNK